MSLCSASVSPKHAASRSFSSMMRVEVVPEISVVQSLRVANTTCGGGGGDNDGSKGAAGEILKLKASMETQPSRSAHPQRPRDIIAVPSSL